MFGPLYQSTVGGIVFQSMQRRHALWATMNAVTALALYGSLKALAHINAFFCRTHAPSFCLVELTLYMVMYIALSTLVYGVFTTDGSKFGGTGIRQQQWLKMMTMFCICSFVASFFAKAVLAALSVHIVSLGAMLNLSPQNLLPTLACVATLLSFVNSNTHSSLQGQPQPIVHSFGSAALYSVKNALPRSFSVAVTLSVIFAALRVAEATYFRLQCPSWAFSKTWAISSVLLCEGFNPELTPLPIFLPNTSLWLDAALAFVASAVLLFQTKLMMTSLAFVSTHPLNFQKLKAQLTQGEASSNRDNNEILMVQALLIGTISPSTASKSDTTGGALNRAANYFSNTAQAEAAAHAARQAALIQTVSHKTFEPSTLPYFGEGRSSNSVVKASIQNMSGSDKLSSVGKKVESFDLLARSLAFQDLQKVASCMPQRRAALFEKHWPQVITAALTMVDAAALQINLLNSFMTQSTSKLPTATTVDRNRASASAAPAPTAAPGTAMGQRSGTSFEDIVRLRERLAQQGTTANTSSDRSTATNIEVKPFVPSSQDENKRISRSMLASVLSMLQRVNKENKVLGQVLESMFLRMCASWCIPVPGYGADYAGSLPMHSLPPICTSTVTHAVESMSTMLVHALAEDKTGFTQRSVCPAVASLLGLEQALVSYCATLQASQCVSISTMGRTQQIRYRARSENAVPAGVRALLVAVRAGLSQVLRAYKDVIGRVVAHYDPSAQQQQHQQQEGAFSREQIISLEGKLLELNESK